MSPENKARVQVEFTPDFKRNLRELAKRYRHIQDDVQPVIEQLQQGEILGAKVPGAQYTVFKVRVRNSDIHKGKSAGYRMIYYLRTAQYVILVTIYSKSDQSDISTKRIASILREFSRMSE